jgi:hypothetical protein
MAEVAVRTLVMLLVVLATARMGVAVAHAGSEPEIRRG